jgi:hypothetical protein
MWRQPLLDTSDPALGEAGQRAFLILDRAVRGEAASGGGGLDPAAAPSIACWSLVHGFARLALDGAFGSDPDLPEQASRFLLPAILQHLSV